MTTSNTDRRADVPAIDMIKEECRIPSPPPIKRVVRWHHVFSLDGGRVHSDVVPHLNGTIGVVHQEPLPTFTSLDYSQQRQATNPEQTEIFQEYYYSMGGHSFEDPDHETVDTCTKLPLVMPIACVAVVLFLLGVFMLYQEGSSHDKA